MTHKSSGLAFTAMVFALAVACGGPTVPDPTEDNDTAQALVHLDAAFRILQMLSDHVWPEPVPYGEMPVLYFDLESAEEYLINHPGPVGEGYVQLN